MIMIDNSVDYDEFVVRLRDKFGFRKRIKCQIKDEDGDLIGLADQEDLDNCVSVAKKMARRERFDTAKMEVCVECWGGVEAFGAFADCVFVGI